MPRDDSATRRTVVLGIWAALALTAFLPVRAVEACSCMASGPPCQAAFQADTVFSGRVRVIETMPDEPWPSSLPTGVRLSRVRVEFDDVQPLRGGGAGAAPVRVATAVSESACGYPFEQGERYVVYAQRDAQGALSTGRCTRTRPLSEGADDLAYFAAPALDRGHSRLSGTVTHWEEDLAGGQTREYGGFAGARVTATGTGIAAEALTDSTGHFELALPPGAYDVKLIAPPRYVSLPQLQRVDLPVTAACAVVEWAVHFDGRISGTIQRNEADVGLPIVMDLVAAERDGQRSLPRVRRARVDAEGRYEFVELPPGRYVVGVDLVRRLDAAVILPTTYHPGASDASAATIVDLAGGEIRTLPAMSLPPARRVLQVAGRVLRPDGRPAPGASISLSDGEPGFHRVTTSVSAGPDGSFTLMVHEGLRYRAHAYWRESEGQQQLRAVSAPFVVGADPAPLTLVLASSR